MRVLFDQSAPYGLACHLEGHAVSTAQELGWERDLLAVAEQSNFDVFLTADKNVRYQQNLSGRKIALVVLGNSPWRLVRLHIPEIIAAANTAGIGSFVEIEIPLPPKKPFTRR